MLKANAPLYHSYKAVMNATAVGGKQAAGLTNIQTRLGSGAKFKLWRNNVLSLALTMSSTVPIVGTSFSVTYAAVASVDTILDTDMSTGSIRAQWESASGTYVLSGTAGLSGTDFVLSGNIVAVNGLSSMSVIMSFDPSIDVSLAAPEQITTQLILDHMTLANQVQPANKFVTINGVAPSSIWGQPYNTIGPFTTLKLSPQTGNSIRPWGVIAHLPSGPTGDISGLWIAVKNIQCWGYAPSRGGWYRGVLETGGSNIIYTADQSSNAFLTTFQTNPLGAAEGTRFRLSELGNYGGQGHAYHFYTAGFLSVPAADDLQMMWTGFQWRIEGDSQAILNSQIGNANVFAYAGCDNFTGSTNYYELCHSRFTSPNLLGAWKWSLAASPNTITQPNIPSVASFAQFNSNPPPLTGV